ASSSTVGSARTGRERRASSCACSRSSRVVTACRIRVRASTPTDAAKRIVPDVREELARVVQMRGRAAHAVRGRLEREQNGLTALRSRPVLAQPTTLVDTQQHRIDEQLARARRVVSHRLDREADAVGHHLARVRALSPLATLERGYAVAQTPEGHVITSATDAPPEFTVRLAHGLVRVEKQSIEETPHDREA
ncbi:MAG: hypothetical protein EON52_22790, partial [Actinomycetales bacterium]